MMQEGKGDVLPLVSVCIVTYNQKAYIGECIESVASQSLCGEFEIVVADDCSTDGSVDVIRGLAEKYKGKVRPIFQSKNVGPFENYKIAHSAARGKYVAHLDGDDLAAPGKLAAQVSFLNGREACAAVFHKLQLMDFAGNLERGTWPSSAPSSIDIATLVRRHPLVGHSSMMYRRGVIKEHLRRSGIFLDIDIFLEAGLAGNIGFIDEPLGFYRTNVGIATSGKWISNINDAIRTASRHGVKEKDINYAVNRQIIRAAIKELRKGDRVEFRRLLSMVKSIEPAEFLHRMLVMTQRAPWVAELAVTIYRKLKYRLG